MIWKQVNHPDILPGYLISPEGYIKANGVKDKDAIIEPSYHSTNGYDFMLLNNKESNLQLFPLDDIIALAYIPIPESLKDKPIKVSHINGDTRDISLENLQWVEDIEEWKDVDDPDVKPDMYEVSSWGRVRNKNTDAIISTVSRGYNVVTLKNSCEIGTIQRGVNRLVAIAFLPSFSFYRCIVNHINGVKNDNYYKNLEWVTYSENVRHAYLTNLTITRVGEDSHSSKITSSIAETIWGLLTDDPKVLDGRLPTYGSPKVVVSYMSEKYPEVTEAIVRRIKKNRKWGELSFNEEYVFEKHRIAEEDVKLIWLLIIDDPEALRGRQPTHGHASIVRKYMLEIGVDISLGKIYAIKNGYAWGHIVSQLPQKHIPDLRRVLTYEEAYKIARLLHDDEKILNGREKTNGSPKTVVEHLKDEIPNINVGIVDAIKRGRAWNGVLNN